MEFRPIKTRLTVDQLMAMLSVDAAETTDTEKSHRLRALAVSIKEYLEDKK